MIWRFAKGTHAFALWRVGKTPPSASSLHSCHERKLQLGLSYYTAGQLLCTTS